MLSQIETTDLLVATYHIALERPASNISCPRPHMYLAKRNRQRDGIHAVCEPTPVEIPLEENHDAGILVCHAQRIRKHYEVGEHIGVA